MARLANRIRNLLPDSGRMHRQRASAARRIWLVAETPRRPSVR